MMSSTGLIGCTGFVGKALLNSSVNFSHLYNTKNIESVRNQKFDLLICAAPQAKKWWANQNPEADWSVVEALIKDLRSTHAEQFILLSTIDVFPTIIDTDESFDCTSCENHAYGQHRLRLEQAVVNHFPKCHIVRLPGLFGPGLKKNLIFDLLHSNQLEKINPNSQFQWYDLGDLWPDLERIVRAEIPVIVLATEPIRTMEIHSRFFPEIAIGSEAGPAVVYDVHTCYAEVFGSNTKYIRAKERILEKLGRFIAAERGIIL
ncbi:MAG TPA: hypothetical protein VIQ31_00035 [Phormidium sp.]